MKETVWERIPVQITSYVVGFEMKAMKLVMRHLIFLAATWTYLNIAAVSVLSEDRGIRRAPVTDIAPKYRKTWAVIVGINYRSLTGAAKAEVPTLATAEDDARSVHDILISNYDYKPENVRLLTGAEATRENIRKAFGDSFLGNSEQVNTADSVLFFFAGHGNRREAQDKHEHYVGLLYPNDVQFVPSRGVDTISCLRIDELLGYLRDYCPARHKLVVLDSCHSGEIFKTHRSAGVNRGFSSDLFQQPAFQAIAAALRHNPTALDHCWCYPILSVRIDQKTNDSILVCFWANAHAHWDSDVLLHKRFHQ